MPPPAPNLSSRTLAPYFVVAGLIHAAAVATRFDALAAKLPTGAPLAIMIGQFPLLLLSGYFESRLAYANRSKEFPLWMRIDSWAVKLAMAFGFMYLVVVAAQAWDVSIGPVDPTPPLEWPTEKRALWFAMFTGGFALIFYMAAASILVPVLRGLAYPLRYLPGMAAAPVALAVGFGAGMLVLAGVQSTKVADFVASVKAGIQVRPGVFVGLTLASTFVPLLIGALLSRRDQE
jgi:hypothetical protein